VGAGHDHSHHAAHAVGARRRALWIALVANAGFLVLEVAAAIAFGSLALLADGVHMVSDVAALAIALVAQQLATRRASSKHTYGLVRAEVIGAQVNAILLLGAAAYIVIEAVGRIDDPGTIDGAGVMVVAAAGLVVNIGSAWVIARTAGGNLNLRGAFWHLVGDALGSLGALLAGAAVVLFGADWVDPVISLFIAGLVVISALVLLRDVGRVLLEGVPAGLHMDEVERALVASTGVEAVHHVHLWSLGSETPALSAHVVLTGEPSLHEAQTRGDQLKEMLVDRFGIAHATLELECHDCGADHGPPD
jgi:cobalt-zinc-cadmium efflux system protein